MKKITTSLCIVLCTTVAYADLTVNVYSELSQGSETEQAIVQNYVGGVGKGYLWANLTLHKNKQAELFCYDGDYSIEDFNSIAAESVNTIINHPKYDKTTDETPVEMLLLYKLQEMHPCTQKSKKK